MTALDLYDTQSANLIKSFKTEHEALAAIRETIEAEGKAVVLAWALGQSDHTGPILAGQELIDRALRDAAA